MQLSKSLIHPLLMTLILILGIGCDQASKSLATRTLKGSPARLFLGESVRLCYALNPGGFLSLGGNLSPETRRSLFVGANGVLLCGIAGFVCLRGRQLYLLLFVSLNLILAGGIGNMIDRVLNHGLVTDFIILRFGPLQTGVFNFADVAISAGTVGIALSVCFSGNVKQKDNSVNESDMLDPAE